jgi:predicted alpha-1,6-mannanase (GH76 family)
MLPWSKRSLISIICMFAVSGSSGYLQQAKTGVQTLQSWYSPSTGLYRTTGWWNSANAITVLVNYSRVAAAPDYLPVISNTFTAAQKKYPYFLNSYYDDNGWWALAWIDAYDLTRSPQYLSMAQSIFAEMTGGWDEVCGGGIWWNKQRKYKNAIANELFLSVAASLANRTADPGLKAEYLSWAQREWTWFEHSGMINSHDLINDGLTSTNPSACVNNGERVYSYNQGVILGGLVELHKADHDSALLPEAQAIADAAIGHLTDSDGILHEPCEPRCGGDGVQFKGIFVRNLMALNDAFPNPLYKIFVDTNADSILKRAQGMNHQFGLVWSGPPGSEGAASQTSALDALIAAAEMQTR